MIKSDTSKHANNDTRKTDTYKTDAEKIQAAVDVLKDENIRFNSGYGSFPKEREIIVEAGGILARLKRELTEDETEVVVKAAVLLVEFGCGAARVGVKPDIYDNYTGVFRAFLERGGVGIMTKEEAYEKSPTLHMGNPEYGKLKIDIVAKARELREKKYLAEAERIAKDGDPQKIARFNEFLEEWRKMMFPFEALFMFLPF